MLKLHAVFVLFFFQGLSLVDSLKKEVLLTQDSSQKADLYYALSRANYAADQEMAIAYADSAIALSEILNLPKIKANSLNIKGVSQLIQSNFEAAMATHLEALSLREELQDTVGLLESQLNIGNILYRTGNANEAAQRYRKALYFAQVSGNQRGQGLLYNNLGSYFRDLWQETDDKSDLDSANFYLQQSLKIKTDLNDLGGAINTLNQLAELARKEGDLRLAENYLNRALEVSEGTQDKELQISLLTELAEFSKEKGEFRKGVNYAESAFQIAEEMESTFLISATAGLLASAYEAVGDYRNAFIFSERKIAADQVLNVEKNKRASEDLLIKYESEKKELENQRLQEQQKFLDLSIRRKNEILIGFGVLLLVLVAGWVYQKKKNEELDLAHRETKEILAQLKVQNEKIELQAKELELANLALKESNRIRERLFSVVSHDLKSPLASLQGCLNIFENDLITEKEFRELLPRISSQTEVVGRLLENLLEWSSAQLEFNRIEFSPVKVKDLASESLNFYAQNIKTKNLQVFNEIPDDLQLILDRERLNFIIRNLISNAIKFTPEGGEIRISYSPEGKGKIMVSDSGLGMNSGQLQALFSGRVASGKGTQGEKGAGVGLMLCKEFTESIGAQLQVDSQENKGSTFSIAFT